MLIACRPPSPVTKYIMMMVLPLAAAAVVTVAFVIARCALRCSVWSIDGLVNSLGQVMMLLLITVSLSSLGPLQCFPHPNGMSSVVAHLQILCWSSSEHSIMVVIAGIAFCTFAVGTIPVVVRAVLLYPRMVVSAQLGFVLRYRFLFHR